MGLLDIIVTIILVAGLITGIKDGLVKRVLGLGGLIAGIIIGKRIYLSVAAKLTPLLGTSEKTTQIIAFALILIIVPLIFSLIAWLIGNLLKTAGLGWVNRLLGGIIGVITNALIVGLIFIGIESFDTHEVLLSQENRDASVFYYPLYRTTGLFIKDVREQIDHWKETHSEEPEDSETDEDAKDSDNPEDSDTSGKTEGSGKKQLQSFEEVV
jgi:membrane protein required for colicin V production